MSHTSALNLEGTDRLRLQQGEGLALSKLGGIAVFLPARKSYKE
ncbi:hypothetical protein [Paenibacillus thiaminolyticus]|nr:hypothetical protein [Paenibacillus thiaminolyticus]